MEIISHEEAKKETGTVITDKWNQNGIGEVQMFSDDSPTSLL